MKKIFLISCIVISSFESQANTTITRFKNSSVSQCKTNPKENIMISKDAKGREFDERPWGNFTVLDDEMSDHKVKRIVVSPGKRLSYQVHAKRSEHWFIVSGQATVILDGIEYKVGPGESINIEVGQAHRCENQGTVPVVFIEVQRGSYFGEDDIVRLEDDFGRK